MCTRLRISKVLFILTKCGGCLGLLWGVVGVGWGGVGCPHCESRWNNKSRQRRRPLHGPRAPAATSTAFLADMLSGPLSTNLDSAPPVQSSHPSVPYSHIHQNVACPSTYRGDRLARLARAHVQYRAAARAFPPCSSFAPFSLQQRGRDYRAMHDPPLLNSHYDGYGGIRTLSASNER